MIHHVEGVPWHAAPIPPRWHRCKPQSEGFIGDFGKGTWSKVCRCSCGAVRFDDYGRWIVKNSRRKSQ